MIKRRWGSEDFVKINYISKGQFGMVWKMKELSSDKIVAVKQISKADVIAQNTYVNLQREIEIHSHLMHKHIIECYGYFTTDTKVFVVLEYASKGNLCDLVRKLGTDRLSEAQIAKILYQLTTALNYLKERRVLHRDVKLENILLDFAGDVKLADFGCSVIDFYDKGRETFCGTVDYLSPEILQAKRQGTQADVWALGVVFYELLYHTPPFVGSDKKEKIDNISSQKWEFLDEQRAVSNEAKELMLKILTPNEKDRITPKEILESSFIQTYFDPQVCIV